MNIHNDHQCSKAYSGSLDGLREGRSLEDDGSRKDYCRLKRESMNVKTTLFNYGTLL